MSSVSIDPSKLKSLFGAYYDRRMVRILLLGIISGFPWVLIASALSLWLKEEGLSRSTIGWAGLIFGVYAFNFLWAPIIDRLRLPFLTNKVGHRKSIIICRIFNRSSCLHINMSCPVNWHIIFS